MPRATRRRAPGPRSACATCCGASRAPGGCPTFRATRTRSPTRATCRPISATGSASRPPRSS
jgi:hypothetical protein